MILGWMDTDTDTTVDMPRDNKRVHHREATFELEFDHPLACHDHNARLPLDFPLVSVSYLKVSACSPLPTMSRRESRTSMNERQSDALFEFENCLYRHFIATSHVSSPLCISHLTVKKKFLLANKHITKSVHVTLALFTF